MKNFTLLGVRCAILFLAFFSSFNVLSQTPVANYTFETNIQGWTVGTNAIRSSSTSCGGDYSIRIADDTSTSIATSPALNLSSYNSVEITFCIRTTDVDNNEGVDLKYSSNGGGYNTLRTFRRGTDFANNGTSYTFTVTLTTGLAINS